jgi:hypothetical protein
MKLDNKEKISIFGYLMGRREVMINGVVFLTLQVVFDVFSVFKHLPSNFKEDISVIKEIEVSGANQLVSLFLFVISYILLDAAYFGNDRAKKIIQDDGIGKYMIGKVGILFIMLIAGVFLKVGLSLIILQFI